MSKTYSITIEEGTTFSTLLTLWDWKIKEKGINPISGKKEYIKEKEPINLSGYTVKACIKSDLDKDVLVNMTSSIISNQDGKIMIGLPREKTSSLETSVNWSRDYSTNSSRMGFLGFYDVILTKNGSSTRVIQGPVYYSRSVSV